MITATDARENHLLAALQDEAIRECHALVKKEHGRLLPDVMAV